ncbi:MAG: sulfur transferase domain-containing protein, partial [Gemmatimonadaceae bacterium]
MRAMSIRGNAVAATVLVFMAARGEAQRVAGPSPSNTIPAPVALDTTGLFLAKFSKVGDDMFIAGQPTERGLREMKARGVTTVVNLRSPEEMTKSVSFDEAALVKQLGMKYVYIPVRGTPEFPYSPAAVKTFADAMSSADGKVLLHCTIAWRASHLWAAYLIQERHVPVNDALASARMINLMDNTRIGGDQQPLEQFLGRTVPE